MKIELKDGTMIHLDSAAELAEALKVIGAQQVVKQPEKSAVDLEAQIQAQQLNEAQRVRAIFNAVNPNARAFMAELLANKKGVRGDRFAESTGFSSDKFGGIMGGVKKCAENQNLERNQFIISEQKIDGTERYRVLAPGALLLKYEFDFRKIRAQKGEDEGISAVSVGA